MVLEAAGGGAAANCRDGTEALIDPLPRDPIPTLGTGPSGPKSIDASVHPERLVPRPKIPSVRAIIGTRRRGLDSTELVPCD